MRSATTRSTRFDVPVPIVVALVVLSLAIVGYALRAGYPLRFYDEFDYYEIADNLAHGRGFELAGMPTAFRPPAWPILLAAFLAVGVPVSVLPMVSALLMIGAALIAALLGVRLTGNRWGSVAGALVLLYPLNVYAAGTLYPQALATVVVLALWLIAARAEDAAPLSRTLCAVVGLLAAVLVLAVPTMVFTAAVIGVWFLWRQRGNRLQYALVAGLAFVLPLGVWVARNVAVMDSPVLFSTSSGVNLLLGNNADATASSGVSADIESEREAALSMNEVEQDAYFREVAVDWITDNPGEAAALYVAKTANYFAPYNAPATESESGGSLAKWVAILSFGAVVAGTVVRLALRSRLAIRPSEWLFLALFVVNAPFMAVIFTRTRFRQPLDDILIVEAAIALVLLAAAIVRSSADRT